MPNTLRALSTSISTKHVFHTLIVFRAPTELSEALADLAQQRRTSISGVIRELLQEGLKK
jgi:hypothetical protein